MATSSNPSTTLRCASRSGVHGTVAALVTALITGLAALLTITMGPLAMPSSAAGSTGAAPDSYTPRTGALFNHPTGNWYAKRRLFTHLIRTVDSVPAGETIRFAVFSFADRRTADALLAAHRRGVRVKLVFAGSNVYKPMRRLRRELGGDPDAKSFAVWCERSCRGREGEMHAKFFSFSRAGSNSDITMIGSNNLTRHNSHEQWSDLYTLANGPRFFRVFKDWFTQLKYDRPVRAPYRLERVGASRIFITPMSPEVHGDPVMQALEKVQCRTRRGIAWPGSGNSDEILHSKILIATHAWNGRRGRLLARKVAELSRRTCRVWVFRGVGVGPYVREILRKGGVAITNGTHSGIYTHQKLMIVNGHVGTHAWTTRVWTGSHNWSPRAYSRDDLLVEVAQRSVGLDYRRGFWRMWRLG